jgi:hypothetical protein
VKSVSCRITLAIPIWRDYLPARGLGADGNNKYVLNELLYFSTVYWYTKDLTIPI